MKILLSLLLLGSPLTADISSLLTTEFVDYHLKCAVETIDDEDVFKLLSENIKNLKYRDAANHAANELINLIDEGYKIDPYNMSILIETLKYRDSSNNATKVIVHAVEYDSTITAEHMTSLLKTLTYVDAAGNATTIIIKLIEHGYKFSAKDRLLLAELSRMANARNNVERIRKALHDANTKSK